MTDEFNADGLEPLLSYEYCPFDTNSEKPPAPKSAIIVKVTLAAASSTTGNASNPIQLKMSEWTVLKPSSGRTIEEEIGYYVSDFSNRPRPTSFGNRRAHPNRPFKPTNMSLRNQTLQHLVYHLDEGLAWCFARNFTPFTQDVSLAGSRIFLNPRLITSGGEILDIGENQADCKFATFIFDPDGLQNLNPVQSTNDFLARFNMQVELLDDENGTNGAFIPIIIDPDVRWPGGDGP